MDFKIFSYIILSIILSALSTFAWIKISEREKIGQPIRKEGNQEHMKKQGTPTMGGLAFSLLFLILLLIFSGINRDSIIIGLSVIFFGTIGFLDDARKVRMKENEGLTPRQKLILQFALAGFLLIYAYFTEDKIGEQIIPFFNFRLKWGLAFLPILAVIIVGTVNAVNLTDGLDGLCSGVSIPVFLSLAFLAFMEGGEGTTAALASLIFAAVLLGFLFFNSHPASIFMGDTGSMAIGGGVCGILLVMNRLPFLMILGGIYFIEALSVIIQVAYFKRTGGKRIFLMSPIHHHFELKGYPEEKVTAAFTIISILLGLLTILIWPL